MNHLSMVRRLLINASRLSQEPLDYATQDIICRTILEALLELERTTQSTKVDNVLDFRMRESTEDTSQMLAHIVDTSNN
jgi:hypothetical protein